MAGLGGYMAVNEDEQWQRSMKCEFCNSETDLKKVRERHRFQGKLYIVENVDADVCDECGERCFHATTLDVLDRLIADDHTVKEVLSVEVVSVDEG
jgi:YgiT-type zinc finger domain-containing protein